MGVFMKSLLILSLVVAVSNLASAADSQEIYCNQSSPATAHGYIVESATISLVGERAQIQVDTLGVGLLTEDGDGTANNSTLDLSNAALSEDSSVQAKSPQWKNAASFLLPVSDASSKYVLYIEREAFAGKSDFSARLKINQGQKESNYILRCNYL
jgi:hypothetical protein